MTYDAVLVARRGLGADELRLASPEFLGAVRWAVYAEQLAEPYADSKAAAEQDPSEHLKGQARTDAMTARTRAREQAAELREALLLDDGPKADADG